MDLLLLAISCVVSFEISWAAGTDLAQRKNPRHIPVPGAHARMRYR